MEERRAAGDWCLLILLRCQRSHEWIAYGCQTGTFHNSTHNPSGQSLSRFLDFVKVPSGCRCFWRIIRFNFCHYFNYDLYHAWVGPPNRMKKPTLMSVLFGHFIMISPQFPNLYVRRKQCLICLQEMYKQELCHFLKIHTNSGNLTIKSELKSR